MEKDKNALTERMKKQLSRDLFDALEEQKHHNPYNQELRELKSIENGDRESLLKSMSETYKGELGVVARDPLRNAKDIAVGNLALASRAAIRGGLTVEMSFSMTDSLTRQLEELTSIEEVEAFKREAKLIFCDAVHNEKEKSRAINPLVEQVKEYVFRNLHSPMQVAELAEIFKVNPDYLSHIFKQQEGISLKKYILNEKIKRSCNMLIYSNYKVQEVGLYLGFNSQSHYSKVFSSFMGMTPSEYRRTYGRQKEW